MFNISALVIVQSHITSERKFIKTRSHITSERKFIKTRSKILVHCSQLKPITYV